MSKLMRHSRAFAQHHLREIVRHDIRAFAQRHPRENEQHNSREVVQHETRVFLIRND